MQEVSSESAVFLFYKGVIKLLKKGDKVKVVYEQLNINVSCVVEDVGQDGSIKLKQDEGYDRGNVRTLCIDGEEIDFIKANINSNIIDFKIESAVFHEKYMDSVRNKIPLWISVGKHGADGISKIAQYYCIAAEKINENLYAYEFKEK